MVRFCQRAVALFSRRRLLGSLLLLFSLAGLPANPASNQASATLHIQITVVPVVQTSAMQPIANSSGAVTYKLQPSTASKMTSQVTVQKISANAGGQSAQSGKGAVLQTTTLVAE